MRGAHTRLRRRRNTVCHRTYNTIGMLYCTVYSVKLTTIRVSHDPQTVCARPGATRGRASPTAHPGTRRHRPRPVGWRCGAAAHAIGSAAGELPAACAEPGPSKLRRARVARQPLGHHVQLGPRLRSICRRPTRAKERIKVLAGVHMNDSTKEAEAREPQASGDEDCN